MQTESKVLAYRTFRLRHKISLRELAQQSGVSVQRISQIELLETPVTLHTRQLLTTALERALLHRSWALQAAWREYGAVHTHLFEGVREVRRE